MRKILVLGILLLLVGSVYAAEVKVNIETISNNTLLVSALDGDAVYTLLDSKRVTSDEFGKAEVTLSVSSDVVDLGITLSKDGSKILYNRFEDYNINSPISLKIMPGGYIGDAASDPALLANTENTTEPEANDSDLLIPEENTGEVQNSEETEIISNGTESQKVTGFSINKTGEMFKEKWYYVVVVIVTIAVILAVIFGMKSMSVKKQGASINNPEKPTVYKKFYDFEQEDNEDPRIKAAEEKIAQAQKDLKSIKNEDHIKQAEKKLQEDQERLEKLRRGEDA